MSHASGRPEDGSAVVIQRLLIEAIGRADRAGANALLDAWTQKHGHERLLADVLEPVLRQVGEAWRALGSFTLAQAYVAGKVAEDTLTKLIAWSQPLSQGQPTKGPVVVGNIEDDFHALGRRMVGTFLRADGWIVHDLGGRLSFHDAGNHPPRGYHEARHGRNCP
ncbi:MAG: cobalamin B12-binding domain-containing protein [Pirellulales bacterium]